MQRCALVGALLAVAMLATACGGSSTKGEGGSGSDSAASVYEQLNGLPPDEQRAKAVELAKEEGTLSLYTSYNSDVLKGIKKAFKDKFGIDVKSYRAHSETIVQRILQESKAGRVGGDAVETNFLEMAILSGEDVFADYSGAALDRVPKVGQFDGWAADRFNIFLPMWNTDIIKPGEEPTSWEDLADPRFDGKLVLEQGDYDWFASLTLYWREQGKSQDEIDALWKKIVDGAKVGKGHTTIAELLAAGQTGMLASQYSYIAQTYIDEGAPLAYRTKDGTAPVPGFPRPQGVAILKGAPHPAAAWLFEDWLLSEEGQKVLVDAGISVSTDVEGNTAAKGVELAKFPVDDLRDNDAEWSARYDALLRGAPQEK